MRLYVEFDINNFEAWSGAVDTKNRIIEEGKADLFNAIAEDIFPDGCTETEMNDFLWFDDEQIFEWLGIRSESQIEKEIEEAEEELEEKLSDLEFDLDDDLTEEERKDIIESYQPEIDEIKERIADLKEELEEI